MNQTSQAVIAIRRPADWFGIWRSFRVRIDGGRAGKTKPGETGEFAVEPGIHTVAVSLDWVCSGPFQLVVGPGSRVELAIRGPSKKMVWWKVTLPIVAAVFVAAWLSGWLLAGTAPGVSSLGVRTGLLCAEYLVILAVYIMVTSFFSDDYWVMWTLERVGD